MSEVKDLSELAVMMDNPRVWLSKRFDVDRAEYDDEHRRLYYLATAVCKAVEDEQRAAFMQWVATNSLQTLEGLQRWLFAELRPLATAWTEEAPDVLRDIEKLEREVEHLRATLRAVEETLNRTVERVTLVEQRLGRQA